MREALLQPVLYTDMNETLAAALPFAPDRAKMNRFLAERRCPLLIAGFPRPLKPERPSAVNV